MNLSRNWLNEFVDLHDITDKQFNDEMTLSGSKVETIERLDESLKNVVAGKILSMEKHPDSDHVGLPARRRQGGAGADRHRRVERPRRRSRPRGAAQFPAARRREDRKNASCAAWSPPGCCAL